MLRPPTWRSDRSRTSLPALVSLAFVVVVAGCGTSVAPSSAIVGRLAVPTPSGTLAASRARRRPSPRPTRPADLVSGRPRPRLAGGHRVRPTRGPLEAARQRRLRPIQTPPAHRDRAPRGGRPGRGLRLHLVSGRADLGHVGRRTHRRLGRDRGARWPPWVALAEGALAGSRSPRRPSLGPGIPAKAATAATCAQRLRARPLPAHPRRARARPQGQNVVFSPTSIALALAMAEPERRARRPARWTPSCTRAARSDLGAGLDALDQALAARTRPGTTARKTHALSLKVANAAFAQRGWPIDRPTSTDRAGLRIGAGDSSTTTPRMRPLARRSTPGSADRRPGVSRRCSRRTTSTATRVSSSSTPIYLKADWLDEVPRRGTRVAGLHPARRLKVAVRRR